LTHKSPRWRSAKASRRRRASRGVARKSFSWQKAH
jgi:hypothetical protein